MVDTASSAPARMVWTVSALIRAVADTLQARFSACTVRGEISGFTRASSGHCYFSLKDAQGQIRAAMFRRAAALLDFEPRDGELVEVRGRVAVYEARGELQLVVESMQRAGQGALFEQFLRLKAKLEADGLFDPERKRAIARYPRRIGVVTSLAAAALRDVASALARRAPHVELVVYPAAVQGSEAPGELVRALETATRRAEVDTLLLCRGGGSIEDLWAFNDEALARAIAACPIPVISGVGHETDFTIADFVADVRAPTPTAAAELAAPARQECLDLLQALAEAVQQRVDRRLDSAAQRLDRAVLRLARPRDAVTQQRQRLALLQQRLPQAARRSAQRAAQGLDQALWRLRHAGTALRSTTQHRLDALQLRLDSANPERVLSRGYAVVSAAGQVVRRPAQLHPAQTAQLWLAEGRAEIELASVRTLDDAGNDKGAA